MRNRLPMMDPRGTAPVQDRSRVEWPALFILFIGGILLTLAHRLSADEGQILTGAWNLFNGRRLYEDFFEFIGPASFAWVGLFFRVLGPSYWTALFASQLLLLFSLWAFHSSSRLVIDHRSSGFAASMIWLLVATTPPFINHNTYGSLLATVFALCLLRALRDRCRKNAFQAGALGALIFFFLQPKGITVLFAGLAAFLAEKWLDSRNQNGPPLTGPGSPEGVSRSGNEKRDLLQLVFPYFGGAAGVGLIGLLLWGLNPIEALITVARGNLAMNHLSLSYGPLLGFLGVATLITIASYREGLLDQEGRVLLMLQGGLWASSAHLPDSWHLWINSFPLVLMVGRLGGRSLARTAPPLWRRSIVVLFSIVIMFGMSQSLLRNFSNTRVTRSWVAELENLLGGEDFFAFTFLPSFYLELQVQNPYYNSVLYVGSHPSEHFQRNVVILSEQRPRYVLLDYASVAKYGHTLDNPVDEFLRGHYQQVWAIPHGTRAIEVWERF